MADDVRPSARRPRREDTGTYMNSPHCTQVEDRVPQTLTPALRSIVDEMVPFLAECVREVRKTPVIPEWSRMATRFLGEIRYPLAGGTHRQTGLSYPVWMAQRLLDAFRQMPDDDRKVVREWLDTVGGSRLLQRDLPRGFRHECRYAVFAGLARLTEPQAFSHPRIDGRFFTFELVDLWMIVKDSVGTNTSGAQEMTYLFTGPGWKGEVPTGMTHISFPTRYMVILGRTYALNTPEDLARVHALQAQYKVMPLSAYGKPHTFKAPPVDPNPGFSMTDKPQAAILALGTSGYFNRMTRLMASAVRGPQSAGPRSYRTFDCIRRPRRSAPGRSSPAPTGCRHPRGHSR